MCVVKYNVEVVVFKLHTWLLRQQKKSQLKNKLFYFKYVINNWSRSVTVHIRNSYNTGYG